MPKLPKYNSSGSNRSPSSAPTEPASNPVQAPKTEAEILQALQVEVGIKNFEQILHTMSEVTGVSAQNTSIRNVYNQVQTSLPTDNDVKVFMASHQVAVTKLAAEYCQILVENAALRAVIWPGFNFGASNAFNAATREFIIESAVNAFWIIATDTEKDEAVTSLSPLFDDILAGEPTNSTTTRGMVKSVCTAVLSSAQVTLL